jgi:DNA-binding NarL/FixJ family response regulator
MDPSRPPLLVLTEEELTRFAGIAGWARLDGFDLPVRPWDVSAQRIACVGVVRDEPTSQAALTAAARGAALAVAITTEGAARHRLVEDLHKVSVPFAAAAPTDHAVASLEPLQHALLAALADGATVTAAAGASHVSRRTANRALADARSRLGVDSTASAVRRWVTARPSS